MKAKIKEIIGTPKVAGNYGILYHNMIMENGDKINIGKKTLQKVGWELAYKISDPASIQEFQEAKGLSKEEAEAESGSTPTPAKTTQPTTHFQKADIQDDILYSVCLKMSSDFYLQINQAGIEDKYGFNPTNICSMALEIAIQAKKDILELKKQ
ncbi:MAG: hypothetical protein NUV57_01615 [archaeon]|nr:hypothetical protein [archaeon]